VTLLSDSGLGTAAFWLKIRYDRAMNLNSIPAITFAPDEWVASEYAKVRWMYDMLGLGDRAEIEFFTGGHCFHCERSFEFLDKHLRNGR
jgi:hypothetical protein